MTHRRTLSVGLLDPAQLDAGASPPLEATFLDVVERQRHASFRHAASQRNFLCGRVLAKSLVARRLACTPGDVRIAYDYDGKPLFSNPTSACVLSVSISHTDGMVAVAVGMASRLGIDVENMDRPAEHLPLNGRILAEKELRDVLACSQAGRVERFLQYWTLKEAWAKSIGVGLRARFSDIEFDLGSPVSSSSVASGTQSGKHCQTSLVRIGGKHLLALSFGGMDAAQIEWLTWAPNQGDDHFSHATRPTIQSLPAALRALPRLHGGLIGGEG